MTSLRARPRASTPDAKPSLLHQLGHRLHHASCGPAGHSLSHETTAMRALTASLRPSSTSILSVSPSSPCSDAQQRARYHFLTRPPLLPPQSRQPLPRSKTTKVRPLVTTPRSEPRPLARNNRGFHPHQRQPARAASPRATVFPSPCAPSRFSPRAHERTFRTPHPLAPSASQPSRPLQSNQAARQDLSSTYQPSKPVNHHLPLRPAESCHRREGLVSVPIPRRLPSTLRSDTSLLFVGPDLQPDLALLSTSRRAPHGFPRRHNGWH